MKLLLVLVGLAAAQQKASWLDDFDPESAYLSIISLRRDFEPANETVSLNDAEEDSEDNEEMLPPPPSPPGRPGPPGLRPGPRPRNDCGAWGPWEQVRKRHKQRDRETGGRRDRDTQRDIPPFFRTKFFQAKCFWPSDSLDSLPSSCAAIPTKPDWPVWMKKV